MLKKFTPEDNAPMTTLPVVSTRPNELHAHVPVPTTAHTGAAIAAPASGTHIGSWVFGYNQKQGGSILQAGARALLIPSALIKALSTPQGRIAAQTLMMMGLAEGISHYAALRPYAIMEVMRRHMPKDVPNPVILDPTTGYGAEYIWLADEYPDAHFIEMDRPDVIRDKLQRIQAFPMPRNVSFEGVNLNEVTLEDALKGRRVDMIVVLAAYVTTAQFMEALLYLRTLLPKGAVVVAPFPYRIGIYELSKANILFRRFATEPAGTVQQLDDIYEMFRRVEYSDIAVYKFSELADDLGKPRPIDVEVIAAARV
jgi:hypothetical protein